MKYDEALRLWGKKRIEDHWAGSYRPVELDIDPATVTVTMDFNAGYACCGGSDPDCYCSFAESPSATVKIYGTTRDGWSGYNVDIDADDFDFASVLKEIVEAGDGHLVAGVSG